METVNTAAINIAVFFFKDAPMPGFRQSDRYWSRFHLNSGANLPIDPR